jgi:hypothetical protein
MVIAGIENSTLHVTKHETIDKYVVMVVKELSEGFHKSAKLIVDNVHVFEDSHSLEMSGAHYAIVPDMDFFTMISRISKSRSYRRYCSQLEVAQAA